MTRDPILNAMICREIIAADLRHARRRDAPYMHIRAALKSITHSIMKGCQND